MFDRLRRRPIGLHVNGRARIVENDELLGRAPARRCSTVFQDGGRHARALGRLDVVEAYIHCRKHIPRLVKRRGRRRLGHRRRRRKGGDYFKAKHSSRPWVDDAPSPRPARAGLTSPRLSRRGGR